MARARQRGMPTKSCSRHRSFLCNLYFCFCQLRYTRAETIGGECDGAGGNHLSLAFAFCFCFGCYCFESSRASPSRVAATLCSLSVVHLTTPRCSACGSCLQFCSRLLFCTLLFCRSFAYTATCRRLSASIYSSRLTSRLLLSVLAVPRCLSYESRAAVSEELAVSAAPHIEPALGSSDDGLSETTIVLAVLGTVAILLLLFVAAFAWMKCGRNEKLGTNATDDRRFTQLRD